MNIGNQIRRLRELKCIKQEQVAHLLGISVTAYGNIERNQSDVNFSRLLDITNAMDITIRDLINFPEEQEVNRLFQDQYNAVSLNERTLYCLLLVQKDNEIKWLKSQLEKVLTVEIRPVAVVK